MKIINIVDEDIINYKEISMFIGMPYCTGKCWRELGLNSSICQNDCLRTASMIEISAQELVNRFDRSELSTAIVFGGLEPMDSFSDVCEFLFEFRKNHNNTVVIYSGYTEKELKYKLGILKMYKSVVVKVGRYIPNSESREDSILSVTLASDNQYAIDLNKYGNGD